MGSKGELSRQDDSHNCGLNTEWVMMSFTELEHCDGLVHLIILKRKTWTSLVIQWMRIHLPTQGSQVWPLVQEDSTWHRATKFVCHNYWACALGPRNCNCWAHRTHLRKAACPRALCSATREDTMMRSLSTTTREKPPLPQLEKACAQQEGPRATKIKKLKKNV